MQAGGHYWGEPKQAPYISYIQENHCTRVCMYLCTCVRVYVAVAIHRLRAQCHTRMCMKIDTYW